MARNWTVAEAINAFVQNEKNNIQDITHRAPMLGAALAGIVASNCAPAIELLSAMPEKLTARTMNAALADGVGEPDEGDAPAKKPAKPAGTGTGKRGRPAAAKPDYSSMGARALYDLCKERGIEVKGREDKSVYMTALKKADTSAARKATMEANKKAAAKADKAASPAKATATAKTESAAPSAMDLFKKCKAAGIKVPPKKPASFYKEALAKAKAKPAPKASDDEEWDM